MREEWRNRERAVLSEENAENSSRRLCDGGEASAKRVADTGVGLLIREHRRSWHALTASKLKYISTTLGGRCTVRGNPRDSPRAEMKGRHEKREFFMNGIGMPLELGIAEGELENHVHLGVGAISQEKWESKRSCQNQMKKGEKRERDWSTRRVRWIRESERGKSMKTAKPQEYRISVVGERVGRARIIVQKKEEVLPRS